MIYIRMNEYFFSKKVEEEVGMQLPPFLERNGYEFLRWRLPIFIQSDIEAHIALRDTDKSLESTGKDLVYLQKDRLEEPNETEIAYPIYMKT